jgi:hypothetical protein
MFVSVAIAGLKNEPATLTIGFQTPGLRRAHSIKLMTKIDYLEGQLYSTGDG